MYEVEIKSLLATKERADQLMKAMLNRDPLTKEKARSSQLNHYFLLGSLSKLLSNLQDTLSKEQLDGLDEVIQKGRGHSVRTRKADSKVLFVVKAVADGTNSSNGTARIEFETELPTMTIEQIDHVLLDSGFPYQAKWSRDRIEYQYKDYTVAIDKNAGYGYVAEFEKVVEDQERIEALKQEIRTEMGFLGVEELKQDRLDRMFKYYNQRWNEYYGTDKVFEIL